MLISRLNRNNRALFRNERGMTLIEIMIVLAIMAAVMGGVLVSVRQGTQRAQNNEARTRAAQTAQNRPLVRAHGAGGQCQPGSNGDDDSKTLHVLAP